MAPGPMPTPCLRAGPLARERVRSSRLHWHGTQDCHRLAEAVGGVLSVPGSANSVQHRRPREQSHPLGNLTDTDAKRKTVGDAARALLRWMRRHVQVALLCFRGRD
jgi:hypothetical protein